MPQYDDNAVLEAKIITAAMPEASAALRKRENRSFPRRSLEDSLRVVFAIRDQNAGNAFSPKMIAEVVGISQKSTNFNYLVSAAIEYGLVIGGYRAQEVALTPLGRTLAFPAKPEDLTQAKLAAFFNVSKFKEVFDHYSGANLPETQFFKNTLIEKFAIPIEHVPEFIELFRQNCSFCDTNASASTARSASSVARRESGPALAQKVKTGLTAFIVMPFVEKNDSRAIGFFNEVLSQLLMPAAQAAGFEAETANRVGSDIIHATIIRSIVEADLVIADLTDHNPNVMFELGLRMGQGNKPVVIVKSNDTPRIFDVDNVLRVCEYNPNLWKSTIDKDVQNVADHIKATWQNKADTPTYMQILTPQQAGSFPPTLQTSGI